MKYTYLEIVRDKDNKVVKRLDVTGKSQRYIDRAESGMGANLNWNEYITRQTESSTGLELI